MLEAGAFAKCVIASEVYPYTIDGVHEKNCYLVPEKKEHKLWRKYVVDLINDKEKRDFLGKNLFDTVQKYNLVDVTKKRLEIYDSLI